VAALGGHVGSKQAGLAPGRGKRIMVSDTHVRRLA